jgi:hypothetical protein
MAGDNEADVRVRLTVDDGATKAAATGLRETLKETNEESEKLPRHGKEFGSELLKAEIYTHLLFEGAKLVGESFHQAFEFVSKMGEASMEAADEANQQVRSAAGLISLMDRGAHSMGEIRGYARGIREELAAAGTQAGVSTKTMEGMFNSVIERGGMSTEKAKELTEQMATVGKIVPQGMEGLAQGFSMMELGIVRARNPIVQLIASTGVLRGNAHAVAAAMQKMTPEQQIENATEAIRRQHEIMAKGGTAAFGSPTLEESRASLGNIREGIEEAMGQAILDKLTPALGRLTSFLGAHSEQIASYAEEVGEKIGGVITSVEGAIGDVYAGAARDWPLIKREFAAIATDWKDAWSEAFGSSQNIHEEMKEAALDFAATLHVTMDALTGTFSFIHNVQMEVANFLNHGKFAEWGAQGKAEKTTQAREALDHGLVSDTNAQHQDADEKYRETATAMGLSSEKIDEFIKVQDKLRDAYREDIHQVASTTMDVQSIGSLIDRAQGSQNEAFLGAALEFVGNNELLTKALKDGQIPVKGGFEALANVIDEYAPSMKKMLEKLKGGDLADIKGQAPTMNFFGGVHIKQDFRDQDPDRIIAVFRRDLAQQAVSRRQARTGILGGL